MRKLISLCFILVLCLTNISAEAEKNPVYTLSVKESTVLQNAPDRNITPQTEAIRHELIAGESPVTGLPWEGDYLPMLVQISNAAGTVKGKGYNVEAAGIGKRAPWGIQYADIIYEVLYARTGDTRLTVLFSDCFAQGQPKSWVGPVRSTRIGQLLLREEWQSGFAFGGGYYVSRGWRDQSIAEQLGKSGTLEQGVLFNVYLEPFRELKTRVKGVKSPDNLSVDIIGLRGMIPASFVSKPRPFLFADANPYVTGYELADTINLDWGKTITISHFIYDESKNAYLRYCGAAKKKSKWAPYMILTSAGDQSEENQQQMVFANLIVQRVSYEFDEKTFFMPNMKVVGKGNADIFIGGRYVPGYWVRPSIADPTVYYDDKGDELILSRGKTFIAQFPMDGLCTFTAGKD